MKDFFLDEVGKLAISCGRDLTRKTNAEQIADWAEEFGKTASLELTREAFRVLRTDHFYAGHWPSYQDMKRAFARAYSNLREQEESEAKRERERAAIQPGRLTAAVLFVSQNREALTETEITKEVEKILSPETTDAEVVRRLRERKLFAMKQSPQPAHDEREIKVAAASERK